MVGFLAGWCVDDGRAPGGIFKKFESHLRALRARHLHHLNGEILAAEAMDESGRVEQAKLLDNIILHDGGCRGGERHHGSWAQRREVLPQHAVVRTKVVSPLRNAVRFVNRNQVGFALGKHLGKPFNAQPLRGNEHKLQRAAEIVPAGLAGGHAVQSGMNARDFETERGKLGCLVVHQGDQRADDQRCASPRESGQLVAERFPRPRRHDQENVPAGDGGTANGFLIGAKVREAEGLFEEREE